MGRIVISGLLCLSLIFVLAIPARGQDDEEIMKYQPPRDYGHDWAFGVMLGLTPEDGFLLGGGPVLYEFGFRKLPYVYRTELLGGVTVKTGAFKVTYAAHLPTLLDHVTGKINAYASEIEVKNFYGYGNASLRDKEKEGDNFYRVNSREYLIQPGISYYLNERLSLGFVTSFKHFQLRSTSNRFLGSQNVDSLGNDRSVLGAGIQVELDTRDHFLFPMHGVHALLEAWDYPDVFRSGRPFQKLAADFRLYIGGKLLTDMTFAVRLAAEKLHGPFPFFESAFLGGGGSLRGYFHQRFAGDASAVGSADLRIALFRMKILVPTEVGMILLGDVGRVWVDDQSEGSMHSDAGAGLWFAPLSRDIIISVSGASSIEGLRVNGGLGFAF